jgi:ssDNA thymidine ADP-ribosyltransferase, DarT
MTSVNNLPSIIEEGLFSDEAVRSRGLLETDIGEDRIKTTRRTRVVPILPGGMVSDYVPFYFAARSPMLYTINRGSVATYREGQQPIIFLVTNARLLTEHGCQFVFTDRNAYYATAKYEADEARIGDIIDWSLMEGQWWNNTLDEPDRMERRMAEFLVRDSVPFEAIRRIGVKTEAMASRVRQILSTIENSPQVFVTPEWYY